MMLRALVVLLLLALRPALADDAAPVPSPVPDAAPVQAPVPVPVQVPVLAPVLVLAHVEPDTVTIGTRFRYVVEVISGPETETVVAQPGERIGDFDIVDFGIEPTVQRDGKTVLRRWYTLVGYTPGEHLVKSPPVRYRVPGEEMKDAPGTETRVAIESVLGKTPDAADIRDIKAPEPVPVDWRPYYLLGSGLLAAALLAWGLYRLLNRREAAHPAAPPRPAHEVAYGELERLRARGLVAKGAFKEYYSALTSIVRTYLEQRFGVRAPEMTTEEFLLATARDVRLQATHRRLLGEFLAESDLVKFAKHLPTIGDSERAFDAARRFVDETAAPAAATEDRRAAG